MPERKDAVKTNAIYSANLFQPVAIFSAPRFVIFVAGPVIIKAASQSSRIPLLDTEAASGIVPYMHSGDAIPRILAGTSPR